MASGTSSAAGNCIRAGLQSAFRMLLPPEMEQARDFVLNPNAAVDVDILSDEHRRANSSVLRVRRSEDDESLDLHFLLVPTVNLEAHQLGLVISDRLIEYTAGPPGSPASESKTTRAYAVGRYIREDSTGEVLFISNELETIRGRSKITIVWAGAFCGPRRARRSFATISADADLFNAGRIVESVVFAEISTRTAVSVCDVCGGAPRRAWTDREDPPMRCRRHLAPRPPQHALDFAHTLTNFSIHRGVTSGRMMRVRAPDGRFGVINAPVFGSSTLLNVDVSRDALKEAALLRVATQSRLGFMSPTTWEVPGSQKLSDGLCLEHWRLSQSRGSLIGAEAPRSCEGECGSSQSVLDGADTSQQPVAVAELAPDVLSVDEPNSFGACPMLPLAHGQPALAQQAYSSAPLPAPTPDMPNVVGDSATVEMLLMEALLRGDSTAPPVAAAPPASCTPATFTPVAGVNAGEYVREDSNLFCPQRTGNDGSVHSGSGTHPSPASSLSACELPHTSEPINDPVPLSCGRTSITASGVLPAVVPVQAMPASSSFSEKPGGGSFPIRKPVPGWRPRGEGLPEGTPEERRKESNRRSAARAGARKKAYFLGLEEDLEETKTKAVQLLRRERFLKDENMRLRMLFASIPSPSREAEAGTVGGHDVLSV